MQLTLGQEARLEQTLSPRMIQFYQMLQSPMQDLEGIISQELESNPALELVDRPLSELPSDDGPTEFDWAPPPRLAFHVEEPYEDDDPTSVLPAPTSLQEHLRWHFRALARTDEELRVGLRILRDVNDDGYFESGIGEVAMALAVNIVEVERVLGLVQSLDPVGVGARDLRECMEIQLRHLAEQGREHVVARRCVEECWEPFARRQHAACAKKLRTSPQAVADAAEFMRANCQPYPGRQFRLPWQDDRPSPVAVPEVRLRVNPSPPPPVVAEGLDSRRLSLRIDHVYHRLYQDIRNGARAGDGEAEHVTDCVRRAHQFIRSLTQRRQTVCRIAEAVAEAQIEFVLGGRSRLHPLTRLDIARRLDLHESTVGRAVNGKFIELPGGEVVSFELFFDSSRPVKLALQELVDGEDKRRPLSDQAIVDALAAEGYELARRTVAKYRAELKIPPAGQRRQ